jgi:CheY-like chemotaxis protein
MTVCRGMTLLSAVHPCYERLPVVVAIIDDNRDFTLSAKVALERIGRYSVWEKNDPARAHQTMQRIKPDLILLDISMPETDGGEVAGRIDALANVIT